MFIDWVNILQVVNVKSLDSTLVSNTPIYYSRVETKYPQFGFTVRGDHLFITLAISHSISVETSNNWRPVYVLACCSHLNATLY